MVAVESVRDLKIINCTINKQAALQAHDTTVFCKAHNLLRTLAKKLPDGPDTYIQTTNNHAKRGAGIYFEVDNTVTNTPCSFWLWDLHPCTRHNNHLREQQCWWGRKCSVWWRDWQVFGWHQSCRCISVFESVFKIISSSSVLSQVSSNLLASNILGKCSKFK